MTKPELKSATIENTGTDEAFPGTFQVVLSTATKDRDGEEVKTAEWQQPLPDHITFDVDHGMSVEKTVGSGKPYLDATGRLLVDGTYSSLAKAQDVRTLVKEGHIRTVSVAFARHTATQKDGSKSVSRELLNGAFVAVPANTEAVVLGSKAASTETGMHVTYDGKAIDVDAAKALDPNTYVSVNVSGCAGGFDISVNAWAVPAAELDAYADSAQRALTAALEIAAGGPVDDDDDGAGDAGTEDVSKGSSATDSESAAVDALSLQYQALRVAVAASVA